MTENLNSSARQHGIDQNVSSLAAGVVQNGLCKNCKVLDFGELVRDVKAPQFSNFSRQFHLSGDTQSTDCQICAIRVGIIAATPDKIYRYVPVRQDGTDGRRSTGLVIDRLLHSKADYSTLQLWKHGASECISTSIHSFTPIRKTHFAPNGDRFGLVKADLPLAKTWYEHCHTHHTETCGILSGVIIPYFKVIDCLSGEVREASAGKPYIALSYVWGAPIMGSHSDPTESSFRYPKTIQDAMLVAIALGIPSLWVDRYCIDQSNEQEKRSLISNMDNIYSRAEITIVAAAGPDPSYGLPGVSDVARSGISVVMLDGGFLIQCPDPRDEVYTHSWIKRGWTYQEKILSRRRLVFTESQMVFQCCSQDFGEAIALPSQIHLGCTSALFGKSNPFKLFPDAYDQALATEIYRHLSEYTGRKFSYSDDILNAFRGIFHAFRQDVEGYVHQFWGIPVLKLYRNDLRHEAARTFLYGLSWHTFDKKTARRPGNWPSWSWSAILSTGIWFGLRSSEDGTFTCQKTIRVSLLHVTGKKEELWTYAEDQLDYLDYHPFIELST